MGPSRFFKIHHPLMTFILTFYHILGLVSLTKGEKCPAGLVPLIGRVPQKREQQKTLKWGRLGGYLVKSTRCLSFLGIRSRFLATWRGSNHFQKIVFEKKITSSLFRNRVSYP